MPLGEHAVLRGPCPGHAPSGHACGGTGGRSPSWRPAGPRPPPGGPGGQPAARRGTRPPDRSPRPRRGLAGGSRQAGGIALHAHHDHAQVEGGLRQPRRRPRIEAPLEHVALDVQGTGHHALLGSLGLRADAHQQRARPHGRAGLLGAEPLQPGTRLAQDLLDRADRAPAADRYHRAAVSVTTRSRPPGPNPKRRMLVGGGEYACTLTALCAEALITSGTYRAPNDLTSPRATGTDGPARRPSAIRSRRAPRATVKAPEDSPWSWKPVRCPGSQLSNHTSWSSFQASRWYQRWPGSYRTRLSHSCSRAATSWTSCRSRPGSAVNWPCARTSL